MTQRPLRFGIKLPFSACILTPAPQPWQHDRVTHGTDNGYPGQDPRHHRRGLDMPLGHHRAIRLLPKCHQWLSQYTSRWMEFFRHSAFVPAGDSAGRDRHESLKDFLVSGRGASENAAARAGAFLRWGTPHPPSPPRSLAKGSASVTSIRKAPFLRFRSAMLKLPMG